MNSDFVVSLGEVRNISVTKITGVSDMVDVHFYTADEVRRGFSLTIGAARTLWYRLTELLYPNAARQLTPRAATATVRPASPLTVAFAAKAELLLAPKRIEITVASASQGWSMELSFEESYELWAYLSERCAPLAARQNE